MAKSLKELKGWTYILGDEKDDISGQGTPSRTRRRKQNLSNSLYLKRDDDELKVQVGSFLLIQEKGRSPEIVLVQEIRFGIQNFIELIAMWFMRIEEIEFHDLPSSKDYENKLDLIPNELFITNYIDQIKVKDIVGKVNIFSESEFRSNIVIDESVKDNTYICRRGCDSTGETFTEKFDFVNLMEQYKKNTISLSDYLKQRLVPSAYASNSASENHRKGKSPDAVTQLPSHANTMEPGDKYKLRNEVDTDEEYDEKGKEAKDVSVSDSSSDVHNSAAEDDSKWDNTSQNLRPTKISEAKGKEKKKRKSRYQNDGESSDILESIATINKRIKIKDSSKQQLLTISPRKKKTTIGQDDSSKAFDISSTAFRDLKAKLHTSTKLSSLPCREDEFTSLYLNIETAIQEGTGCCIYVSGTPGLGKTATIREVISSLRDLVSSEELDDFDYVEINGLKLISPVVAYEVLWQKISGLKVTASNAALLLESYFSKGTLKKPLVVLMDELDQIITKKQNVMYNFFNWPTYANSKLIVIAVANTMDLPERMLSNKISSRLGLRRIQFIGYTYEQLGEIIKHRLEMLAKEKKRKVVISQDAIGFASRKVASVSGDARRALAICRRAVEIAELDFLTSLKSEDQKCASEEDTFYVQISHISKAINETVNTPISQYLSSLPYLYKLVLVGMLLRKKRSGLAENPMGDVIDEMRNLVLSNPAEKQHINLKNAEENLTISSLLYNKCFGPSLDSSYENLSGDSTVRMFKFSQAVNELIENGIINQQNILGERNRAVSLNISEEEVFAVLKHDEEVGDLL